MAAVEIASLQFNVSVNDKADSAQKLSAIGRGISSVGRAVEKYTKSLPMFTKNLYSMGAALLNSATAATTAMVVMEKYGLINAVVMREFGLTAKALNTATAATIADTVAKKTNETVTKQLANEERRYTAYVNASSSAISNQVAQTKRNVRAKKEMSATLKNVGNDLQRFGRFMTRYVTTVMTLAIAKGVKFAASIESQTVRFGVLVQSMEKGARLFEKIIEFSAKTPFLLPELDQAAQVLLAFGSPLDDVMDELRRLGDVAQGDAEKLERVATSFGKVRARGTAHMRELNRFIMSGVPIIAELNKQFGISGDTLFKMIKKNQISFENIQRAIQNMTDEGGRFYNMTETVAKTLEGRFSTAVDNLNLNLAKLVSDMTPRIKEILESFIDWSQGFRQLDEEGRKSIVTLMVFTAAIGPLSLAIAGLIKVVSAAMAGNPFTAILLGVIGLATTAAWLVLRSKMKQISAAAEEMNEKTTLLQNSLEFTEGEIPGLSREMFDLAKAYDAYSVAVEQAARVEKLRLDLDTPLDENSDIVLAFNKIQSMSEEGFTGFRVASDISSSFGALSRDIPEAMDVINSAVKDMYGVTQSVDTITNKQLLKLDWQGIGRELQSMLGTDIEGLGEFLATRTLEEIDYILSGDALRDHIGIGAESLIKQWGETVSKGMSDLAIDVESGLIDYAASIDRVQVLRNSIEQLQNQILEQIESGKITKKQWQKLFPDAKTQEEAIKEFMTNTSAAMDEYMSFLEGAVAIRLEEIRDESKIDNAITNFLGITDEKDIKKQLETQLDSYAALMKSFGYSVEQIEMFASGEELAPLFVQEVMDAAAIAKRELNALLQKEEKISLFEAFFTSDGDVFETAVVEEKIGLAIESLAEGLSGVSSKYMTRVLNLIKSEVAGTYQESAEEIMGSVGAGVLSPMNLVRGVAALEGINLLNIPLKDWGDEFRSLFEVFKTVDSSNNLSNIIIELKELYSILGTLNSETVDRTSLIEAVLGDTKDLEEFKRELEVDKLVSDLNDAFSAIADKNKIDPSVFFDTKSQETLMAFTKKYEASYANLISTMREYGTLGFSDKITDSDKLNAIFEILLEKTNNNVDLALDAFERLVNEAAKALGEPLDPLKLFADIDNDILYDFTQEYSNWLNMIRVLRRNFNKDMEGGMPLFDENIDPTGELNEILNTLYEFTSNNALDALDLFEKLTALIYASPKTEVKAPDIIKDIGDAFKEATMSARDYALYLFDTKLAEVELGDAEILRLKNLEEMTYRQNILNDLASDSSQLLIDQGNALYNIIVAESLFGQASELTSRRIEAFGKAVVTASDETVTALENVTSLSDVINTLATDININEVALKKFADILKLEGLSDSEIATYLKDLAAVKDEFKSMQEIADDLNKSLRELFLSSTISGFEEFGKVLAETGDFGKAAVAGLRAYVQEIINALPRMLLQAGLMAMANGHITEGWILLAASGFAAIMKGASSATPADVAPTTTPGTFSQSLPSRSLSGTEPISTSSATSSRAIVAPVNVSITNNAGAEIQTNEKVGVNGEREIEMVINRTVSRGIQNGAYKNAMKGTYGLTPLSRR